MPGPDKQFSSGMEGAMVGATSGAITGAQVGAGTGPGIAVGAGLGFAAGAIQGIVKDQQEEDYLALAAETQKAREVAYAQEILEDQFKRRMEMHPTREIYPADLFFDGDETRLKMSARPIVRELAHLNKHRLAWSRLVVAAYVKSRDKESPYARHLAERRSKEIANYLIGSGIDQRRVVTRAVVTDAPVLVDPADRPERYSQAIELIPLDR